MKGLTQHCTVWQPQSCVICVDGVSQPVELQSVLRTLPGRRAVFKAYWQGQTVLVKLFVGKYAKRDSEREIKGITALLEAGITAPRLLACADVDDGKMLFIEFLDNAHSADALLQQSSVEKQLPLLEQLVGVIAQQHRSGLIQKDIHLNNFLKSGEVIYTIDGAAVIKKNAVSQQEATTNLALFFAQNSMAADRYIPALVDVYNRVRNTQLVAAVLQHQTQAARQKRWQHYVSKLYRTCSEFVCKNSLYEFRVVRRAWQSEHFDAWLSRLDDILAVTQKPAKIKNGYTTVVARVEFDGRPLIIKRYNIKGIWHALSRCARPSRAWVAWRNGNLLRYLGIATPVPVALLEKRIGPLRGAAFIVMEAIDGMPLDKVTSIDAACIADVVQIIRALAVSQVSHGDMKASNFMVSSRGVSLIDLDTLKQHHSALRFRKVFAQDIQRFMRNWEDQPAIYAAFEAQLQNIF